MQTKKGTLLFAMVLFLAMSFTVNPQFRIGDPDNDKIKVNGNCYVTLYLNGFVTLSKAGAALLNQNVYMNSHRLRHQGGGDYIGAITSSGYSPAVGNTITIKLKPTAGKIFSPGKSKMLKEVVLGIYTLNGYVKWKYPRPNTVIIGKKPSVTAVGERLKFTWDHFGAPFRARVKIRNMTHNREVFNRVVPASAEEISVPAIIIQKGDRYQFYIGGDKPLGKFKLSKHVAKRSKIVFYYTDIIYVSAK